MMDSFGKSSEKSTKKYECEPCKLDGENISGEFWCFECQEFLCKRCKTEHKRHKSSRNHNLVSASDAEKKDTMATAEVEEQCSEHKEERLKDRNDEMTESMLQKDEVEQFCDKMKEIKSKAEMVSLRKKQNVTSIQNQQTATLSKADNVIKKAKAEIDGCREKFKNKVSCRYKEQTAKPLETEGLKQIDEFEQFSDKKKGIESETEIDVVIKSKAEIVSSRKRQNAASIDNEQTTILGKADDVIKTAKAKIDKCHEEFKNKVSDQYKKQTSKPLETEGLKQIDEFEQFSDKKKRIESETEMDASRKRGIATSIQNQQTIINGRANDVIQDAKAKLDKCYEKFKDHVSYHCKEQTTTFLETADKIDSIQNSITDYQKIRTSITGTGFKPIFTLQRIQKHVENYRKQIDEYAKEDRIISLDTEISIHELEITTLEYITEVDANISFFENTFSSDMDDLSNAGSAKTNVSMNSTHIDDLVAGRVWDARDIIFSRWNISQ